MLERLPGLPREQTEEDRKDRRVIFLIDQHGGDAGGEDGDPEGEFEAGGTEDRVEHLAAIQRQHRQQVDEGPDDADAGEDAPEISGRSELGEVAGDDQQDDGGEQELGDGAGGGD